MNNRLDYKQTVRVAVGDTFYPFLTTAEFDGKYYAVLHERGHLPMNTEHDSKHWEMFRVCYGLYVTLTKAITEHQKVQGYDINPYSFIFGWCIAKGINLKDEGVLDVRIK